MRIEGRESLGVLDAANRLAMLSQIAVSQAGIAPRNGQVRVQVDGAFMQPQRSLGVFAKEGPDLARHSKSTSIARIKNYRLLRQRIGTLCRQRDVRRPSLAREKEIPMGKPRVAHGA